MLFIYDKNNKIRKFETSTGFEVFEYDNSGKLIRSKMNSYSDTASIVTNYQYDLDKGEVVILKEKGNIVFSKNYWLSKK